MTTRISAIRNCEFQKLIESKIQAAGSESAWVRLERGEISLEQFYKENIKDLVNATDC